MPLPKVAIIGSPGFIRKIHRFDDEALLGLLGQNAGNLMFQFASTKLIANPKVHISNSETPYNNIEALHAADLVVVPCANHLRLNADWTSFNNYLRGIKSPIVILGLGAQSPKIGGEYDTIKALKQNVGVREMVNIIRDKAALVTVRGEFSRRVCEEMGLNDVKVLGCPSALINPDRHLGVRMAAKLKLLQDAPDQIRLAVAAAAPFEISDHPTRKPLEQKLFAWARASGGRYIQQSGGLTAIRAAMGKIAKLDESGKNAIHNLLCSSDSPETFWRSYESIAALYTSAPEWIADLSDVDLVVGGRLHGAMAGIAAGVPGVVIAHDSRTGELIDTMHLPTLRQDVVLGSQSAGETLSAIQFDGHAFDRWRRETASEMADAFAKIGIVSTLLPQLNNDAQILRSA